MPKGYAVVLLDVQDHDLYVEYARGATEVEARYGGRPLVVGDAAEVVEGRWPSERIVVLEFPSLDQARAWYADPEYQALVPLRHRATTSRILLMDGFIPGD
jgi:uncharacterized protein (DUF1330 family)